MTQQQKPTLYRPARIQPPKPPANVGTWIALFIFATVFLSIIPTIADPMNGMASTLACLVGMNMIGVPLILVIAGASRKRPDQVLNEQARYTNDQERSRTIQARKLAPQAPDCIEDMGVLGAAAYGNLAWCSKNAYLLLPERELAQHGVLIGASGSGKTVTLMRIVHLAAIYNYKVFFIDAKPSRQTAAHFLAFTRQQLGTQAAMFPRQQYNGWNGDGNAILNRLMAIELFTEPYYKAACKRILNTICKAPPGPPKDSKDFLHRLDTLNLATIPGITAKDLSGVQNRYHAFFDTIEAKLDGTWSFDTVAAGYLLLDGTALKEEAAALGRYLVEDFAHYITTRKPPQHKVLLIIDEYSALSQSGADTANLFERIRESGGAILVSGQGYASMGQDINRMLDAANFYILHRSAAPEEITRRAGTQEQLTQVYQFGGTVKDGIDHKGNVKFEEKPAIHPNIARQLDTGEAIIISHGRYIKGHITPAPSVDPALIAQMHDWMNQPTDSQAQQPAPQIQTPQPPIIQPPQTNQQPPHTPELL